MFEKFSVLDVDAAGRGGEYTVQVCFSSFSLPSFTRRSLITQHFSHVFPPSGRLWMDERRRVVGCGGVWTGPRRAKLSSASAG